MAIDFLRQSRVEIFARGIVSKIEALDRNTLVSRSGQSGRIRFAGDDSNDLGRPALRAADLDQCLHVAGPALCHQQPRHPRLETGPPAGIPNSEPGGGPAMRRSRPSPAWACARLSRTTAECRSSRTYLIYRHPLTLTGNSCVQLLHYVRDEEKFPDLATLTAAIAHDAQQARAYFAVHGL